MTDLVYGVGLNCGTYPARENIKTMRLEYVLWLNMLRRCFSEKRLEDFPTYKGCIVSDNFKHYSFFYEWCHKQVGFGEDGWHLDKDLLIKGNKIYSEDTCIFLPPKLNTLILSCKAHRGELPVGVCFEKSSLRYTASCMFEGKKKKIGRYSTPEQAFFAYKTFKESYIKQVAEQYKDVIDPRAYKALLEYEVNIED